MFAELKAYSNYSFLEGASHPEELIEKAAQLNLSAIALTDRNGVYGIPKAYWHKKEFPKLKLITGVTLTIEDQPDLVLICKNLNGYKAMCRLISLAHQGKPKGHASLTVRQIQDSLSSADGLFALLDAESDLATFKSIFQERTYLMVSQFRDGFDAQRLKKVSALSKKYAIEMVASNQVLFHQRERKALHDILRCISYQKPLAEMGFHLLSNAERYVKSTAEMQALFYALPQAIENTQIIAQQCDFCPSQLSYQYPSEWIPAHQSPFAYLKELTYQGASWRYQGSLSSEVKRLIEHELDLIRTLQFEHYFLTIFDIVNFAKSKKILCQGRGSAANSIVCYCLGITNIDPQRMDLLFERFISIERNEPPDIDVDFEHERREEVIAYIYQKYGYHRAAMVSAVIRYQKRSALREVVKAFGIKVGSLSAKKINENWATLLQQSTLPDIENKIKGILKEIDGFPRHLSIHSGGFTLSSEPLNEIVPIEPARMKNRYIVQWDKNDLDYLGLLKIDILALGMLSAIRKTLQSIGKSIDDIPAGDTSTYRMIQRADTIGVFQVESRAQMNMSGRLKPKSFYDLVVQIAIVRPGPIQGQMVHPYLRRRSGIEKVVYPHPTLVKILQKTLGVPIFQEQIMKIAIELGDFSPGEADQLRRAIAAWRSSGSIEKVSQALLARLKKKGIPASFCKQILEHMRGFAHYGFPESHAASFALICYVSAYLKCHYPAEFACALLNSQPMGFYAPHSIIDDVKNHGVKVLPIDVNASQYETFVKNSHIRLGLRHVKHLSQEIARTIVTQGPYTSLPDFFSKVRVSTPVFHHMALAGAFSSIHVNRRDVLWQILSHQCQKETRQYNFFSSFSYQESDHPHFQPSTLLEDIQSEYCGYRFAHSGHPMQALRDVYPLPKNTTYDAKRADRKTALSLAGLILLRQKPPTANGVCFATIEDEFGLLDLVLFKKDYARLKTIFLQHYFLNVSGYIDRDGHAVSLIVKNLWTISPQLEKTIPADPAQYFW